MDERPEAPPEGKLLAEALERSGMSIRLAAKRAGISYGRWRQIATGYQNVSAGSYAAVRGPAGTVARMAEVVGVTPEELEGAGRRDAAAELRLATTIAGPDRAEELTDADLDAFEARLGLDLSPLGPGRRRGLLTYLHTLDARMAVLENQAAHRSA